MKIFMPFLDIFLVKLVVIIRAVTMEWPPSTNEPMKKLLSNVVIQNILKKHRI